MGEVLELIDEQLNTCHELFWHVVVKDIHIDPLVAACHKRPFVLLVRNTLADTCHDQRPWEDGFQITSGHLQSDRVR